MNIKQAEAKLRALLGKHAHYELHPAAPNAETRTLFRAQAREAGERYRALEKARADRERELLADPMYRDLCQQVKKARADRDAASWRSDHCRIVAGTRHAVGGVGFFSVEARGDSWTDVIAQLEQKRNGGRH